MTHGPAIQVGSEWYPIHRAVMLVGRRSQDGTVVPHIDLSSVDPRRRTSRRHAELTCERGVVHLRDLGSTNGTLVNERPAPAPSRVRLEDGDRLSFGGVEARFAQRAPWPEGLLPAWP